jgi:hypothetical protein
VQQQPTGSWAAYVKNHTPHAISLKIPFGTMEALDTMAQAERLTVQKHMRNRYATLPAPPDVRLHHPDLPWRLEDPPGEDPPGAATQEKPNGPPVGPEGSEASPPTAPSKQW